MAAVLAHTSPLVPRTSTLEFMDSLGKQRCALIDFIWDISVETNLCIMRPAQISCLTICHHRTYEFIARGIAKDSPPHQYCLETFASRKVHDHQVQTPVQSRSYMGANQSSKVQ